MCFFFSLVTYTVHTIPISRCNIAQPAPVGIQLGRLCESTWLCEVPTHRWGHLLWTHQPMKILKMGILRWFEEIWIKFEQFLTWIEYEWTLNFMHERKTAKRWRTGSPDARTFIVPQMVESGFLGQDITSQRCTKVAWYQSIKSPFAGRIPILPW